jgi:2-succinyl-5-enolpyruvyl-6-hydroxy-3-cyclohexene-1-carboxylate synthase
MTADLGHPNPPNPPLNPLDPGNLTPCNLDRRNLNTLWASVLVETLYRLGLRTAIICPGSRSAPLAVAFAQHPQIEALPLLDERSASFFALGLARRTHRPVVLVCTSGTAGANFYPAVIEARQSRVPLLVMTADRPPEMRDCNAGQAIAQQHLFSHYPNWFCELAVPETGLLAYLRQTLVQAWDRTQYPVPGPVHLNIPLRDPLAPVEDATFTAPLIPGEFFSHLSDRQPLPASAAELPPLDFPERGLILVGPCQSEMPEDFCWAISSLANHLGYPVLAEGLSPLRSHAHLLPNLVSGYDVILRNSELAQQLRPDLVIRLGDMPTSKVLRQWLSQIQPQQWVIDESDQNLDPLHGYTLHLRTNAINFASAIALSENPAIASDCCQHWIDLDLQLREAIAELMTQNEVAYPGNAPAPSPSPQTLRESKVAWLLSRTLPPDTPIFISNSMPVRDVEWFWLPSPSRVLPFFNRGANGIDGSLSTAMGIAHASEQAAVMLTGDLALLHDTNGFLGRSHFRGHLTIILINNNGGGIFEMLPIRQFDPPFEEFFATPQAIEFSQLAATYGVQHEAIGDWETLAQRLNPLPQAGVRILEVKCDRASDAAWRKAKLSELAAGLTLP